MPSSSEQDRTRAREIEQALFGEARAAILHETVAIVMLDAERRVFVFRRAKPPPGWTIPAGHWEHGETAREAAARELREETGLEVEPNRLSGPVVATPPVEAPVPCRRSSLTNHRYHVFLLEVAAHEWEQLSLGPEADLETAPVRLSPGDIAGARGDALPLTPGTRFVLSHPDIVAALRATDGTKPTIS